jgi:hypothetical protein
MIDWEQKEIYLGIKATAVGIKKSEVFAGCFG